MRAYIFIVLVGLVLRGVHMSAEQATGPRPPTDKGITEDRIARKQVNPGHADHVEQPSPTVAPPTTNQVRPRETKAKVEQVREDTEIQRKLVRATYGLVSVGILQAIVFFWTLRSIKRQADLTQAQLELAHRPWVAADVAIASSLVFDNRGGTLMLNVTMKNVGHSVAKYVSLWTEFVVAGVHDLNQAHESLCNIMKQPVNEKSDYGWLLFPGQVVTEPRPVIANRNDIEEALKSGPFKDVGAVGLHLIGCVDYQSSFDPKKRHQTRFVHLVGRIDRQRGALVGTFDSQNKSYDGIVLTPTMHGASAD